MRDLIVLVPDKQAEHVVRGGLSRPQALGIRPVDFKIIVDEGRDGGVRRRGSQLLRVERRQSSHAVLILDYEGCGATDPPGQLESSLDAALSEAWGPNGKAIVVEPEIETWIWGAETHLREVLGWRYMEGIRTWLSQNSFDFGPSAKPLRPKEALNAVFRRVQVPRSSACYERLARRISLKRCEDPAFRRLCNTLAQWFPTTRTPSAPRRRSG